ncbi:MAG: hypothetical protein MPK62_03525 [Alphaproteobacteria bacterium]|nr:hypothetical protein [Alphaproteobacteria bacterium]MDA8030199.1 hypothetical protein [Alphaproteobacteria bacterium]
MGPEETLNSMRVIHCVCPGCCNISRASDLRLQLQTEETWLDRYEEERRRMEEKIEEFGEKERSIKNEAVEKGRKAVPKLVAKYVRKEFVRMGYDMYDVKPILDPVDFVIFNGMTKEGTVKDVSLVSSAAGSPHLTEIRARIRKAIEGKSYEWGVLRCNDDGTAEFVDRREPPR